MDKIARQNIYIGSLYSLRNKDALHEANITHIVSVVNPAERRLVRGISLDIPPQNHLVVEVFDEPCRCIIKHFPLTNRFIKAALAGGGTVLVHCGMGISRSSTIVIAFLMKNARLAPERALEVVRVSRPACTPNSGFMEQLKLYNMIRCTDNVEGDPVYRFWLRERVEWALVAELYGSHMALR